MSQAHNLPPSKGEITAAQRNHPSGLRPRVFAANCHDDAERDPEASEHQHSRHSPSRTQPAPGAVAHAAAADCWSRSSRLAIRRYAAGMVLRRGAWLADLT